MKLGLAQLLSPMVCGSVIAGSLTNHSSQFRMAQTNSHLALRTQGSPFLLILVGCCCFYCSRCLGVQGERGHHRDIGDGDVEVETAVVVF
jgi:hypothetical protein